MFIILSLTRVSPHQPSSLSCSQEALKLLLPESPLSLLWTAYSPSAFPPTPTRPPTMSSLGRGIHTPTARADRVHLPPARHGIESPFIYLSQFPPLGLSGETTRSSIHRLRGTGHDLIHLSTLPISSRRRAAFAGPQCPWGPARAPCSLQALLAADLSESTGKKTALLKG